MTEIDHIYQHSCFGEDWFTYPNLYKFVVDRYPSGSKFVEVGSWKGRSSSYMCVEIARSNKNINFFCVDTWQGSKEHGVIDGDQLYKQFLTNMKPLLHLFSALRLPSVEAAELFQDNSLDFVFVDASHEYEHVKQDIASWLPKIAAGGLLAGHDYDDNWPGVKAAVQESFENFVTNEGCWAVFVQ